MNPLDLELTFTDVDDTGAEPYDAPNGPYDTLYERAFGALRVDCAGDG